MAEAAEQADGGAEGQVASGEQTGEQGQEGGEGDPLSALRDRMEETSARTLEVLESIQQGQQQGQQQPPEQDPYGQQQVDPYGQDPYGGQPDPNQLAQGLYGPDGQPDPYAAQMLVQQLQQQGQQVGQVTQELQALRAQMGAEKLEQQYPDLQDGEKASALLQEAQSFAAQQGHPELGRSPALLEVLHLAGLAKAQAAQEKPAGEDNTSVESGAGAAPEEPEVPAGQRIAEFGRSNDPGARFWGAN